MCSRENYPLVKFMLAAAAAVSQQPSEKLAREILVLAEVCAR